MPRGDNLDGVPRNVAGLLQGESTVVFRRGGGKLESSRAARARELADAVLGTEGSPELQAYYNSLRLRIMTGMAPHMETYLARLKHGDPVKNKETGDDEMQARFDELRDQMTALLRDHPELARQLAAATARRSAKLLPMPRLAPPPADDDEIL